MRFCKERIGISCLVIAGCLPIILSPFFEGCVSGAGTEVGCFFTAQETQQNLPSLETYIMNVESKQGSRVDVYAQLPYRRLQFEKDEDSFTASYTISYVFWDESGTIFGTKDIEQKITVGSYRESVSPRSDFSLQTFFLPPGKYTLEIVAVDEASKLSYKKRQTVIARDFTQGTFSASSLLFLEGAVADSNGQISLRPIFPSGIPLLHDSLGIFQEIYRLQPQDSLVLSYSYALPKPRTKIEESFFNTYPPDRFGYYAGVSSDDSVYYQKDSLLVSRKRGTDQVLQFFPCPRQGFTSVTQKTFLLRNGQRDTVSSTERFLVHNATFPRVTSRRDLILAVGLIGWGYEMDSLRATPPEGQEAALAQFWTKHGGVVRRREFEQRLAEANEFFTSIADGWKTPMGITYVVCGPPESVECGGRITETWYYTIGNRTFAIPFREMSDNDELPFYEMVPNSIDESLWAYFVDSWRRQ